MLDALTYAATTERRRSARLWVATWHTRRGMLSVGDAFATLANTSTTAADAAAALGLGLEVDRLWEDA
jgi:hypothetical protein